MPACQGGELHGDRSFSSGRIVVGFLFSRQTLSYFSKSRANEFTLWRAHGTSSLGCGNESSCRVSKRAWEPDFTRPCSKSVCAHLLNMKVTDEVPRLAVHGLFLTPMLSNVCKLIFSPSLHACAGFISELDLVCSYTLWLNMNTTWKTNILG